MQLPFLKEKSWPRIAKPMDEKFFGGSPEEMLEESCIEELMEAVSNMNVSQFRQSVEALVMNCFEMGEQ